MSGIDYQERCDGRYLTWNVKIAHQERYALHPLADVPLQLKYDLGIAEKRYHRGLPFYSITLSTLVESLQNRER